MNGVYECLFKLENGELFLITATADSRTDLLEGFKEQISNNPDILTVAPYPSQTDFDLIIAKLEYIIYN
jgi:hypothetical protein